MLLRSVRLLQRPVCTSLISQRTVFILSSDRKRKPKIKKEKTQRWAGADDGKNDYRQYPVDVQGMKELRELKSNLSRYVKAAHSDNSGPIRSKADHSDTNHLLLVKNLVDADSKKIAETSSNISVTFDPNSSTLFTPVAEIPQSFQVKLGPAVKYLVTKDHQNWLGALAQIEASGGFRDVSEVDIRKLVYLIPKNQLVAVFSHIERLLEKAEVPLSPKIVNAYLKGVISGGSLSGDSLGLLERRVEELRLASKKSVLSRETYEILIEAYGKCHKIEKMEQIIQEMKSLGLQPTANVYKTVMNTCVYKTKDHKQAVQLFDSMKFLSGSMAPGESQYQDIIVSYVNNNDVEKALDLYEEMLVNGISMNQRILVALAKGCAKRKQLRLKAWDFIFEIYRRDWKPTVPTTEYMIYLAAKDGDLSLARALYQQLNLSRAASPRAFGFLLLAYACSGVTQNSDSYTIPSISSHEVGRNFRRNMLDKTDFLPSLNDPESAVPFLPRNTLTTATEILSESNALMMHTALMNPSYLSQESVNSFLQIAAKVGTMKEFLGRYERCTYFDASGVPSTRTVMEPNDGESFREIVELEIENSDSGEVGIQHSSANSHIQASSFGEKEDNVFKRMFPRSTNTYAIALQAASKNKNFPFAQSVWKERGNYRKSSSFRRLSPSERKESDFKFAAAMVNCLADMTLLDDALAILVSTEYQFKWTWKELKTLHEAAVHIGNDKVSKTVRGVVSRAQKHYEGKIKKNDFKRYVSQRGY